MAAQRRKLTYILDTMPEGVPWLDAGDLFHSWKSAPETEILLLNLLYGVQFHSIPGNHELPYHNADRLMQSSFSVLCAAEIIDNAQFTAVPCAVPKGFYSGESLRIGGLQIAIMHGMVWEDKPPLPGMEGCSAVEILREYPQYDVILTGHNHKTFVVEHEDRILVNPGSLMRSAIDQVDHRPCFFILYDDRSVEPVYIPVDDDVFADDVYQRQEAHADRLQAFLERVQDTEGFSASFEDNLEIYCQRNGVKAGVREEISRALEGKG